MAQEYDLKTRTIKSWIKQQFQNQSKASESEEDYQSNRKKKTKADKDLMDFERNFNQNSDAYHYEITSMDLLKNDKLLNQQESAKPQQRVNSTPQQTSKPLNSEDFFSMKIDSQLQQSQKFSLQNFDALLLLLDQDDEIHHLVSLLRNQERQIEELKKTQSEILEYMCSHLTKKPKKI